MQRPAIKKGLKFAGIIPSWTGIILTICPGEVGKQSDHLRGQISIRYVAHMKNQLKELVEKYGDIGVLWFDGEWEGTWSNEYGKDLYNYVRNLSPDIIINNRVDVGRSGMEGLTREGEYAGDFGTPEQEIPSTGLPDVDWERV